MKILAARLFVRRLTSTFRCDFTGFPFVVPGSIKGRILVRKNNIVVCTQLHKAFGLQTDANYQSSSRHRFLLLHAASNQLLSSVLSIASMNDYANHLITDIHSFCFLLLSIRLRLPSLPSRPLSLSSHRLSFSSRLAFPSSSSSPSQYFPPQFPQKFAVPCLAVPQFPQNFGPPPAPAPLPLLVLLLIVGLGAGVGFEYAVGTDTCAA